MAKITMRQAIIDAMQEEMAHDDTMVVFGEDVAKFGGAFSMTKGLYEEFGGVRVFDTPITESTIVGAALGLALSGLRPVPELQFGDFVGVAFDEIYNKLGKWKWMHGGTMEVPVTLRLPIGIAGGAGPEHSQSPQALFMHAPGLYIAIPSTPYEAKGLLKTAIRDNNPVLFFEHKVLYDMKGEVPEEEYFLPLGKADIKREGTDVTIIATALQVHTALNAAKELEKEGISVEVVDPRTLAPLDKDTILSSVRKTGRVIMVHEEPKTGGMGAELSGIIGEEALFDLQAPFRRIGSPDVPIAQNIHLEQYYRPSEEQIIETVKELMEY
ncbi:alpha-ketoacid dehydrogenase subunit beta [Alkalihalophilus pseudofirmus]|uniref:alpha-ketoacid dehydrogenase subunit beta n=1 Tax=Alkalihalobacterium alkalinitrilicum TaxID=427920 RepID=UPI00094DC3C6|nr:alpha-ketoacid dehydrogenase subunit beta [Alkalihalobacterium alkalinitrilicum]OLO37987.1 alpha-ketoacid dehydrogenase subunit beta [Alkalihalophilus pseudofirmus]